jgi:hypothetical protein
LYKSLDGKWADEETTRNVKSKRNAYVKAAGDLLQDDFLLTQLLPTSFSTWFSHIHTYKKTARGHGSQTWIFSSFFPFIYNINKKTPPPPKKEKKNVVHTPCYFQIQNFDIKGHGIWDEKWY